MSAVGEQASQPARGHELLEEEAPGIGQPHVPRWFHHWLGPLHVGDGGVEHREEGEVGPFQAGEVGEDVVGVGVRLRPVEVEGHEQVEVVQRRGELAGCGCGGDDVPGSDE
jgi:hypothetical protein